MSYKTTYHAISSTEITDFNIKLKKYSDEGHLPYGGISVSSCYNEYNKELINTYSVILGKTEYVKDEPLK